MKKLSEGIVGNIGKRSLGKSYRKEDGKSVHTCIDNNVILQNWNSNYNRLIEELISIKPISGESLLLADDFKSMIWRENELTPEEKKSPYTYCIYKGLYSTSLYLQFSSYEDILDWYLDDSFKNEFPETDYKSICNCISSKFTELGEYFDMSPRDIDIYYPNLNKYMNNSYCEDYISKYHIVLINESDLYNSYCDTEGEDMKEFIERYICDISREFKELGEEDFIMWNYSNGKYIALPINPSNIRNFKKYLDYTKEWFNI